MVIVHCHVSFFFFGGGGVTNKKILHHLHPKIKTWSDGGKLTWQTVGWANMKEFLTLISFRKCVMSALIMNSSPILKHPEVGPLSPSSTNYNTTWVTDKIWYMAKGHPKVGWAPIGFAVAAPCTNLPEGIVLGIVLGWAPIGFAAMATPRPSEYYVGHT